MSYIIDQRRIIFHKKSAIVITAFYGDELNKTHVHA